MQERDRASFYDLSHRPGQSSARNLFVTNNLECSSQKKKNLECSSKTKGCILKDKMHKQLFIKKIEASNLS